MRRLVVPLLVVVLGGIAPAQFIRSRADRVTPIDLPVPAPPTAALERDPKNPQRILDPDYFCSACAAEGRIAARNRDDMRSRLELDLPAAPEVGINRPRHYGEFRLMGQEGRHVLRFLFEEIKCRNVVFIEDDFFRAAVDLPGAEIRASGAANLDRDIDAIRPVFPDLPKRPTRLSSHQRAHLMLARARRIRQEFEVLIAHRPGRSIPPYMGPYLGCNQKFELYVFARRDELSRWLKAYIGDYPTLDGAWTHVVKDGSMVVGLTVPGADDAELTGSLAHRLTICLGLGYRSYAAPMPVWLLLGMGHLMERREESTLGTLVGGDGPTPSEHDVTSFADELKSLVAKRRYLPLEVMANSVLFRDFSTRDRIPVWSRVHYLRARDPERFAQFFHLLKSRSTEKSLPDFQKNAFESVFGQTMEAFDEEWRRSID